MRAFFRQMLMDGMRIPWYDLDNKEGNVMEDHPRRRKKRQDVKVHYIQRNYNRNILSCQPCEQKENASVIVNKKQQ